MTKDICSLVEASPLSLSPLQGELKSTTMEYSIYSPKAHYCDQSLLVKKCGSSRVRHISKYPRRRCDVILTNRRSFVVGLSSSDVTWM